MRAYRQGSYELVAAQPRLPRGVAVRPTLSPRALEVVSQLDGRRTLRELDAADALPHLRELVALGFLEVRRGRAAA